MEGGSIWFQIGNWRIWKFCREVVLLLCEPSQATYSLQYKYSLRPSTVEDFIPVPSPSFSHLLPAPLEQPQSRIIIHLPYTLRYMLVQSLDPYNLIASLHILYGPSPHWAPRRCPTMEPGQLQLQLPRVGMDEEVID